MFKYCREKALTRLKQKRNKAFTLVEVLIVLTIIGVVTVMVLPTFIADAEKLALRVRRKVLISRVNQAISLIGSLKDYKDAYDFVDIAYRDIVKLHYVCKEDEVFACDLPQIITTSDGQLIPMPTSWNELNEKVVNLDFLDEETNKLYQYSQDDSKSISFITDNQETINLFFNPKCKVFEQRLNPEYFSAASACVNMIYDLNGLKPPNKVGEDIGFITVFRPVDSTIVAPVPYFETAGTVEQSEATKLCRSIDSNLRVPSDYELAAMFVNEKFLPFEETYYWSSITVDKDYAWYLWGVTGTVQRTPMQRSQAMDVRCVYK